MPSYIALIRKDPDSDYGVDFPDFPGCVTAGDTLEEARTMAAEALAGHAALMLEQGESLPEPAALQDIMSDPDNADTVAFLVTLPEFRSKAVRVNITLEEKILRAVDDAARKRGMSRSKFLSHAAQREIEERPR